MNYELKAFSLIYKKKSNSIYSFSNSPPPTPIPPTPLPADKRAELDEIERRTAEQRRLVCFLKNKFLKYSFYFFFNNKARKTARQQQVKNEKQFIKNGVVHVKMPPDVFFIYLKNICLFFNYFSKKFIPLNGSRLCRGCYPIQGIPLWW